VRRACTYTARPLIAGPLPSPLSSFRFLPGKLLNNCTGIDFRRGRSIRPSLRRRAGCKFSAARVPRARRECTDHPAVTRDVAGGRGRGGRPRLIPRASASACVSRNKLRNERHRRACAIQFSRARFRLTFRDVCDAGTTTPARWLSIAHVGAVCGALTNLHDRPRGERTSRRARRFIARIRADAGTCCRDIRHLRPSGKTKAAGRVKGAGMDVAASSCGIFCRVTDIASTEAAACRTGTTFGVGKALDRGRVVAAVAGGGGLPRARKKTSASRGRGKSPPTRRRVIKY